MKYYHYKLIQGACIITIPMIKELSQQVAEDLCAQQVITSICDCVKQLIENSIDARSTRIQVSLEEYGKQKIRVKDDGCGISSFQFLAQKGSTSKNKGNYSQVNTLGFRGQALHSLAKTSSRMLITSTPKSQKQDENTKQYDLRTNILSTITPKRSYGTLVEIQSLFEYLPVRRYELLNKYKEFMKKIDQSIKQYSLIYPHISFVFKNYRQGKEEVLIETINNQGSPPESWRNRVKQVLGLKIGDSLVYISSQFIQGWIMRNIESGSSKQNTYLRKSMQFLYLNKRPIDPLPKLSSVFDEYYRKYNKSTKYLYIINIKLPWQSYDVNLTPNKREILIKQALVGKIIDDLREAIQKKVIEIVPSLPNFQQNIQRYIKNEGAKGHCCPGQLDQIKVGEAQQIQQRQQRRRDDKSGVDNQITERIKLAIDRDKKSEGREEVRNSERQPKQGLRSKIMQSLNERMSMGLNKKAVTYSSLRIQKQKQQPAPPQKLDQTKRQDGVKDLFPFKQTKQSTKNSQRSTQKPIVGQGGDDNLKIHSIQLQKTWQPQPLDTEKQWKIQNTLEKTAFKQFQVIGQFNKGFIFCQHETNFYLVDQHAASEKFHFQRLLSSARTKAQLNEEIYLTPLEIQSIVESTQFLQKQGYEFQILQGGKGVKLETVPVFLNKNYGKNYFLQIAATGKKLSQIEDYYTAAATKACRTAVMVGDVLQSKQMKNIVSELSNLMSPWNCPHGRPTLIYLGKQACVKSEVNAGLREYSLGIE